MRAWEGVLPLERTVESGTAVDVRRPKPLIPLRTALDSVNSSSRTSLFLIPVVLMLTRIASARKGVRITSITTDVTFLVVLAFIRFCLLDQLMRCVLLRDEHHVYNQCASGPTEVFGDSWGSLSPAVDKWGWSRQVRSAFLDHEGCVSLTIRHCRPQATKEGPELTAGFSPAKAQRRKGKPQLSFAPLRLCGKKFLRAVLHAGLGVFLEEVADIDRQSL
jgi:hypothetical protein